MANLRQARDWGVADLLASVASMAAVDSRQGAGARKEGQPEDGSEDSGGEEEDEDEDEDEEDCDSYGVPSTDPSQRLPPHLTLQLALSASTQLLPWACQTGARWWAQHDGSTGPEQSSQSKDRVNRGAAGMVTDIDIIHAGGIANSCFTMAAVWEGAMIADAQQAAGELREREGSLGPDDGSCSSPTTTTISSSNSNSSISGTTATGQQSPGAGPAAGVNLCQQLLMAFDVLPLIAALLEIAYPQDPGTNVMTGSGVRVDFDEYLLVANGLVGVLLEVYIREIKGPEGLQHHMLRQLLSSRLVLTLNERTPEEGGMHMGQVALKLARLWGYKLPPAPPASTSDDGDGTSISTTPDVAQHLEELVGALQHTVMVNTKAGPGMQIPWVSSSQQITQLTPLYITLLDPGFALPRLPAPVPLWVGQALAGREQWLLAQHWQHTAHLACCNPACRRVQLAGATSAGVGATSAGAGAGGWQAHGKPMKCAGCERLRYCSEACQLAAWPRHRAQCKEWQEQRKPQNQAVLSSKHGTI